MWPSLEGNARAWAGQAENPPKPLWAFGWIVVATFVACSLPMKAMVMPLGIFGSVDAQRFGRNLFTQQDLRNTHKLQGAVA
jgi:hypothetical protein